MAKSSHNRNASDSMGETEGKNIDPGLLAGYTRNQLITIRVSVLARLLRSTFDRRVARFGITRSQWSLIAVVSRLPGASQRVIAEALEISEASAGRLIERLCNDGLLERRERNDDRRARAIYLTDKAEPLLEQLSSLSHQNEERAFRGFNDEELDQLNAFLGRLYDNVTDKSAP